MNKVQIAIFHLGNARIVMRKALAFCGLMSILLTAACSPTPSDTSKIATPQFTDDLETDTREGILVTPEDLPETQAQTELNVEPKVKTSAEQDAKPQATELIPHSNSSSNPNLNSTTQQSSANQGSEAASGTSSEAANGTSGETAIEAGGTGKGSSSKDDTRSVADRLSGGNYLWATMPTFVDTYKDPRGQIHEHFKVSPGESQELKELLAKMRDELVAGNRPQLEIKEQGACGDSDDQKEASTKSCDTTAPICISLKAIKVKAPGKTLEQSVRPLIMREFARQQCADDALAKQVEGYYNLPTIQNLKSVNNVASMFVRVRAKLLYLQSALTTGLMPNAGKYAQKIDSKEEICDLITQAATHAEKLQTQVVWSEDLTGKLQGMKSFCDNSAMDRSGMLQSLNSAIKIYDQMAQDFSKKSGMIVIDFSKHLWPHE